MSDNLKKFPKELRPYVKAAKAMGYAVEGKNHPKLVLRDERGHQVDIITVSATPGGGNRAIENAIAELKRHGIEPKKR